MVSSTSARVLLSLVPRRASRDILKSKLVDYTINLLPDEEIDSVIRLLLQSQPVNLETINQTMYNPVRYQPIAISIETKTPDGSEQDAMVQLGVWVAAHFNRLRMLSHEDPVSLTLPLLYVSGAEWFLLFASDSAEQVVYYFLICLAC